MNRTRLILLAMLSLMILSACNTIEGFGKDVKKAGDKIETAGSSH